IKIGQRLAGVSQVSQAVDDRAGAIAGQLFQPCVARAATNDHVNVLAEYLSKVVGRFALAPADVLAKEQRRPAKVAHRRLEADASAQRRPLEQERLNSAGEDRIANALGELVLQLLAELEN